MNAMVKWTLLIQVGATLAMVGLIWFVQVVHYPLFAEVGRDGFRRYEMDHQRLTTYVVAPLMLAELATAVMLLWWRPAVISTPWVWLGLVLLGSIWIMTYAVQVPQHAQLALSYDEVVQRRLVLGNWYRTLAWTARGMLVLWMVNQVVSIDSAQQLIRNTSP